MKYLFLFAFLILVQYEVRAFCGCRLPDDVKSNFEYADVVFTGKVLDRTPLRRWFRDTTNIRAEYEKHLTDHNNLLTEYKNNLRIQAIRPMSFKEYKANNYSMIREIEYTFEVTKIYKGKAKKKLIKIRSGSSEDCCGFQFKVGQEYLVYGKDKAKLYLKSKQLEAYKERKGTYETSICTLTTNLEKATAQIAELEKL